MISTKKIAQKNTLRSIFAWVLLLFFCFQTVIVFLYFEAERILVKHQVKEKLLSQIPDNQLIVFEKEIGFDENEFRFGGKMYDVVRKEINGKTVKLFCFQDDKETALNNEIENQIENTLDNHPSKQNQQKLIDFLKINFISTSNFSFEFGFFILNFHCFSYVEKHYSTQIFSFFQPPIF